MPFLILALPFLISALIIVFEWVFPPSKFLFSRRLRLFWPVMALSIIALVAWLPEANNIDPGSFYFSQLGRLFLTLLFLLTGVAIVAGNSIGLLATGRFIPITLGVCGMIQAALYLSNPFLVTLSFVAANFFSIVAIVDQTGGQEERFVKVVRSAVRYLIASVLFGILLFIALVFLERLRLDPQLGGVIKISVALLTTAFAVRLGIFPFNLWLPEMLEEVTGLAAFLVVGLINVAATIFLVDFLQKNPALIFDNYDEARAVMFLGLGGSLFAALLALGQNGLGKMLAYIISSQYGLVLFGLASPHNSGKSGALFDLANLALVQLLIFTSLGVIYYCNQGGKLEGLSGLARRVPVAALGLGTGLLAMGGVPLLSGFAGKYLIVQSAAQEGLWWALAAGGVLFLGLAPCLRYFHLLFMGTETPGLKMLREPFPTSVIILGLVFIVILGGLWPSPMLELVNNALKGIVS